MEQQKKRDGEADELRIGDVISREQEPKEELRGPIFPQAYSLSQDMNYVFFDFVDP